MPNLPPPTILGSSKLPSPTDVFTPTKSSGIDYSAITDPNGTDKANQIIDNIPDLDTGKKDILKDITQRGANNDVIKNSILTLQNAHPGQDGYFIDMNTGVPVPLKLGEKPPKGHDVASVWGTQKQAEDDSFIGSLAKHTFNGIIGAVEGYASLSEAATGSLAGHESANIVKMLQGKDLTPEQNELLNSGSGPQMIKNTLKSLKFATPSKEKESILNTEGMKNWTDIFDPDRWHPTTGNVQGNILQGLESVISFAVGRGGGLAKGANAVTQKALTGLASYNLSLTQMYDVADEAGLKGDEKQAFAVTSAIPQALLESTLGVGALFTGNTIARTELRNLSRIVAGNLERDATGKLTKGSLEKAFAEMTKGVGTIAATYGKTIAKTTAGETLEEGLQGVAEESSKQLYDKIKGEGVFNADVLSPKSVGGYVNDMIGGLLGSIGPSAALSRRSVAIEKAKARSENAFEIAKGGESLIRAFEQNIDAAVQRGDISQEEGDAAKFKVNAFAEYHAQTQDKNLDDEQKKKAFDLSFQISGLRTEIPTEKAELDKLSPIELADVHAKKEQEKGLQKELTDILLAGQIATEPIVADKVQDKVEKAALSTRDLISRHGDLTAAYNEENISHATRTSLQDELNDLYNKGIDVFGSRRHDLVAEGKTMQEANDITQRLWRETESGKRATQIEKLLNQEHTNEEKTNPSPHIITNLDEIIDKGSGRLTIHKEGRHIEFNTFDVAIDSQNKTAEVTHIEKNDSTQNKGVGYDAYIELGQRLAKKGITLESMGQAQHPQGKKLWDRLVEKGHAIRVAQGRYRFIVKNEKPKSERRKNAPKFDQKDANGTFEFNKQKPLEKKEIIHDYLDTHPELNNELEGRLEQGQNNKWFVNIGGRYLQLARNIIPDKYTGDRKNFPLGKEIFKGSQGEQLMRYTQPVGVRLVSYVADDGSRRRVLSIYNKQTGKHIVFGQEKEKGNSKPSDKEIAQFKEIQEHNHLTAEPELENPVFAEKQVNEPLPALSNKEQFINEGLDIIKKSGSYDPSLENVYKEHLSNQFDANNNELSDIEIHEELEKETAREQAFAETGQFQKQTAIKGNIEKIIEKLKASFSKINVIYDENLKAAAKVQGNTITINPYYAGIDTPIHEYGHILIDSIGYQNKVIQATINQLKGSNLWREVSANYPELSEEMLGKEVLAEAIGREGAEIFDKVTEQSKFKTFLQYIFDKLKSLLGVNKNIAKSLARQIIGGINTKELTGQNETEQFSKKSYKPLENMTNSELTRKLTLSFESYREKVLGENLAQERKDLQMLDESLASGIDEGGNQFTPEEIAKIKSIKTVYKQKENEDKAKWMAYREDVQIISSVISENRLEDLSNDKVVEMYNFINNNFQNEAKDAAIKRIMVHIAMDLFNRQKALLEKQPGFSEERAANQDLSDYREIKLKVLSHMTDTFPDLQALSKIWDEAYFAKTKESKEQKRTHEKLGLAVVEDMNKRLGITERLKNGLTGFVFPVGRKYFSFLDKNGKMITLDEAKKANLSPAQIEYLKFARELMAQREGLIGNPDIYNMPMEVLKIDKTFLEAYKTQGVVQAFSNFLGNTYNIQNVRIAFANPNTGKNEITEFANIEKALITYGNKGLLEKGKAMALLAKYNSKARKQLKTGTNIDNSVHPLTIIKGGDYSLDSEGNLINKFNRPRNAERGYSQDFYKAIMEYIDDSAHVKHISPLLPIINSIEHLNKTGVVVATPNGPQTLHAEKPNVVKWMNEWKDLHIFKEKRVTTPELDFGLKFMRFMTSATTMLFNLPAGAMNLGIGIYNNWRAENSAVVGVGLKRLFANPLYVKSLMDKYGAVNIDQDSNPMISAGGIFFKLGHAATKWGEIIIQSSMVAGQMSQEDFDSFEYKDNAHGIKELVLKAGVNEKALEKKMISYINRTSDIQGKYSDKDTRNIMNNELGKAVFQFKVWIPDWWKTRYGSEYINQDGKVIKGSWSGMIKDGFAELRKDIHDKGKIKGLWENKAFMSNLKGVVLVSFLMGLKYRDDDDDKKRSAAATLDRTLGDLLFIFDPNSLKFTISRPVAALATVSNIIDAADHMMAFETTDYDKQGNAKIAKDLLNFIPGGKKIKQISDVLAEE